MKKTNEEGDCLLCELVGLVGDSQPLVLRVGRGEGAPQSGHAH